MAWPSEGDVSPVVSPLSVYDASTGLSCIRRHLRFVSFLSGSVSFKLVREGTNRSSIDLGWGQSVRLIEMRQDVVSGSGQAIRGSSVSAGAVDDDIAPGSGTRCSEVSLLSDSSHSAIPAVTSPLVVPTRGHLDSIRRLMTDDRYIGRGSKQRALVKSIFHNPFNVSEYGRDLAIQLFLKRVATADSITVGHKAGVSL